MSHPFSIPPNTQDRQHDNHSFTGISHGKPRRIKAPSTTLSEMKEFLRDGQCEVSHFYRFLIQLHNATFDI